MPQGISWFSRFLREDNNFLDPISNNLDPRNPNYPYSALLQAWIAAASAGRILLLASATFWFDPANGSDVTGTGTNAAPWATPAPLINKYDFGGQTVTLELKNNATTQVTISSWTGSGLFVLELNSKSIVNAAGSAVAIAGVLPNTLTIQNGTLAGTGGPPITGGGACALQHLGGGKVNLSNVTFGACDFAYVWASGLGGGQPSVNQTGPLTCSAVGNQAQLFFAAYGAVITFGFFNPGNRIDATANLGAAGATLVSNSAYIYGAGQWHTNGHTVPATNSVPFNDASVIQIFNGWQNP